MSAEARPTRGRTGQVVDGDNISIRCPVNSATTAAWLGIDPHTLPDLRDVVADRHDYNSRMVDALMRGRPGNVTRGGGRQKLDDRPDGEWLFARYRLGIGLDGSGLSYTAPVIGRMQTIVNSTRRTQRRGDAKTSGRHGWRIGDGRWHPVAPLGRVRVLCTREPFTPLTPFLWATPEAVSA